jgi:hypothetical protein
MTFASAGVALTRSKISFGGTANRPSIDPCSIAFDDGSAREHRRFPEVDCQLSTSAPRTLAAEGRAAALAVGTDRVLIAAGTLSEETYLRALGAHLGMAFDPLDEIPCAPYPIGNDRLIKFAAGLLPMMINNVCLVVAPRASAARRIGGITKANPQLARRFPRGSVAPVAAYSFSPYKSTAPPMSALPPRADIRSAKWNVCFWPVAVELRHAILFQNSAPCRLLIGRGRPFPNMAGR